MSAHAIYPIWYQRRIFAAEWHIHRYAYEAGGQIYVLPPTGTLARCGGGSNDDICFYGFNVQVEH